MVFYPLLLLFMVSEVHIAKRDPFGSIEIIKYRVLGLIGWVSIGYPADVGGRQLFDLIEL